MERQMVAATHKRIKESRYMDFLDFSWSRKLDSVAVTRFRDYCESKGIDTETSKLEVRDWEDLMIDWTGRISCKENKIKESNMPRGNGGWPYDENDIVWDDNDEILVNLRMDAYPAAVQDAVMSPAAAFDADGYPALSPEIEDEMLSFDTDVDDKIKSYGGYEFVYDGDGESGMTAPQDTGMWCMTYGEFQEMLQQEDLPESWFDIQLKSSWY